MALPEHPVSRIEHYMSNIVGEDTPLPPDGPKSRIEQYLAYLAENGGGEVPYTLRRLGDYVFDIAFNAMPSDNGSDAAVPGACSSYVQGGKLHRNLDWDYSELASFHVVCPGFEGMAFLPGLTDASQDKEKLMQLPYHLVDGRNKHGIMVATHILYNDWDWEGSGNTPLTKVPYLILSGVKSMATLATDIGDLLSDLRANDTLAEQGYLAQYIVTDGTTTKAILPPETSSGSYVIVDITSNPKLANFRWVSGASVTRVQLQTRPTGVERWNAMPCPLSDLRFTKAYEAPTRLSEFIGIDGTDKDSTDAQLEAIYDIARAEYLDRERDGTTWQTMHSVVYSANGMEHLWVQENWGKDYQKIELAQATQAEINARTGDGVITPQNLDYAVGAFLRNGSAVMTDAEKAHAQGILGSQEFVFTMADNTTVTKSFVCTDVQQN